MSERDLQRQDSRKGVIEWMVTHRVAPNLLMFMCLVGGFLMAMQIKQEVFPEFDLERVSIRIPYPGSSPEEVEQGIVLAVEEAVRGLDGVSEVTATASEGFASVNVELLEGADTQKVYQDIQQEVDRITTLPEDAEEPDVTLASWQNEVLQLQIYGDAEEWALRELAEEVRDRLLQDPEISQVELRGARDYEIRIDVSQERLRSLGLTLRDVAQRIDQTAVEVPGGKIETSGGEILLRVRERRDWATEFARIPIVATPAGTVLYLEDVATVTDGFEDSDRVATFNGSRAIGVAVFRIGDQTPISVAEAVRSAMPEIETDLPPGVKWSISNDRSEVYRQRLQLLLRNAFIGLSLVLLLLGCFLEFRLAFWVTMGIPTSFLGAFLFLPGLAVTINMISMFAFIIALGIVVDDAIVAGENIYEYRQRGMSFTAAAVQGAKDVSVPIAFSILTNIVAFLPLSFVPGVVGKIWSVIPTVVVTVFTISWVEALLILPAHLAHSKSGEKSVVAKFLHRVQGFFSRRLSRFIQGVFHPFLSLCIRWRVVTVAIGMSIFILVVGYVMSGRIGTVPMPRVESDRSVVTAVLPIGSPLALAEGVRDRLEEAAAVVRDNNGGSDLVEGVFSVINENNVEVSVYLTDPDIRPMTTGAFTRAWRETAGGLSGLESVKFQSDRGGPGGGADITIELSHRDIDALDRASADLAEMMTEFPNVRDIDDGYTPGKKQLDFRLRAEGHSLGLTSYDVARQVRAAFEGTEALRQQRGRNEVRVKVRLPESERASEHDIENLFVRTPAGRDVPLMHVAEVAHGRAYTSINRRDGRRTVTVTADVEPATETTQVLATVTSEVLPELTARHPGLSWGFEGRQAAFLEGMESLFTGFALAALCIYGLLAIPFRSYTQPLVVMTAIPFGIVGAAIGHIIMGYNLSLISMMGVVALSGVVVNDALILIDYANRLRREGVDAEQAIVMAGVRRFRPILLTTLTTFGGLAPMIFETSRQARFMVPMAISLGYGIVFATSITLLIVPSLYLIVEDVKSGLVRLAGGRAGRGQTTAEGR